jgi:hypothetical protein
MKTAYAGVVAGMLLIFSAAASAAEEAAIDRQQQIGQAFDSLDANQDGRIDAAEAAVEPGLSRAFERIAPDGALSEEQFAGWYKQYDQQPASE